MGLRGPCSVGLKSDGTLWFWGEKLVTSENKIILWLRRTLGKFKIPIHLKPFQTAELTPVQIDKLGTVSPDQFSQLRTNGLKTIDPTAPAKAGMK